MPDIVISAENLGKKYLIGHQRDARQYTALRDVISDSVKSVWRKTTDLVSGRAIVQGDTFEEVWALRDVSFEIKRGEAVGIIGRNGAGKSTLLKILSRITEPSAGRAVIKGRIASLLEVGTGFHPELSGRENVYLNGSILGMTRGEIKRKFDEIVAFAEIEKYLDTPVKRYSSGMYVRLAFAVAAHLEPEILVVDEVLAVGDFEFQKKCLGKMGAVAREGRTVLFVSHNMAAIEALCSSAMVISHGHNSSIGAASDTIRRYLDDVSSDSMLTIAERLDRRGKGKVQFTALEFRNQTGTPTNTFSIGDDIEIALKVHNAYADPVAVAIALSVNTSHESLISADAALKGISYRLPGHSDSTFTCKLIAPPLNFGNYDVNIAIFHGGEAEDWITSAARFSIESGEFDGRVTTNPFPVLSRFEWSSNLTQFAHDAL